MAEALVSALLQVVFDKLARLVMEEHDFGWGVNKEIERLRSTLSTIQAVLEDAEERQVQDKAVRNWLGKLKDAAYDADDIIDQFMIRKAESEAGMRNKVCSFFSLFYHLFVHFKMGHQIKMIREKMDAIASEKSKFHLKVGKSRLETSNRLQSDSVVVESETFGRDNDKKKLVDLLTNTYNNENILVIPIVGMGGLGKTTLAQLAYNDQRVKRNFELQMWVCVSDDFDLRNVIKAIIESATGRKCELLDLDVLQRQLQEKLRCKKFLLVLDDVWNEKHEKWDRLKHYLKGEPGSRMIVTTRSEKVALIMGTSSPLHLPRLSEDDCWSLFKKRAFGPGEEEKYPNLAIIGKDMANRCGGLPLAAKALGSLMRLKREETEWKFVNGSEIWKLQEEDECIFPALKLSYNHLPSHLKRCFAFCSIFPKDYEFKKDNLILLWMAEGFIQPAEGCKQVEDIGKEYFNELLWRSFFQDVKMDDYGNITRCKMHDLMHDLAMYVADNECINLKADRTLCVPKRSRHLSLSLNVDTTVPTTISKMRKLHTLLVFNVYHCNNNKFPHNFLSHFMHLRVLDLTSTACTQEMLHTIGELKHLRYLDLSNTLIHKVPETITRLLNLQTLKLSHCHNLQELPKDMRKMISLRHLKISTCTSLIDVPRWFRSLTQMPANIGQLKCLQTLPIFIVSTQAGCSIKELKDLNLQGELFIKHLENVKDKSEAKEARLKHKKNLEMLGFSWSRRDGGDPVVGEDADEILEAFEPHSNLRRLLIHEYGGFGFPHWMSDLLLPNLVDITLVKCRCEELPSFGQLPCLKSLTICGMDSVKCIDNTFYEAHVSSIFPSLKELTIKDMPNLEICSVESRREIFPRLAELTVVRCPKLKNVPFLSFIEKIQLTESNGILLRTVAMFSTLVSLYIESIPEIESLEDGLSKNHTHLSCLSILNCQELRYLSSDLEKLTTLVSLRISNCKKLISLQNITSLHVLDISVCPALKCIDLQSSKSLRYLTIQHCQSLESFLGESWENVTASIDRKEFPQLSTLPADMEHLVNLQCLNIWNLDKLTALPEGLRHATSLEELQIGNCSRLKAWPEWLGNLTSLRSFHVWNCPEVASLPPGTQHMAALWYLSIAQCPHLESRCEKEKGEDWGKIKHIPHIEIGWNCNELLDTKKGKTCTETLLNASCMFQHSFT